MRSGFKLIGLVMIAALLSLSIYASAQIVMNWRYSALAWNPDGTILASSGWNADRAAISFYDAVKGWSGIEVSDHVLSISWSPDGSKIAARVSTNPETFSIWDTATRELLVTFEQPGATADYFAYWNPAGEKLATAAGNNVLIHDTADGTKIAVLSSPGTNLDYVISIAWNGDGSKLFTASADDIVRVWDVATASILNTLNFADSITTMTLSPDKRKLAVGLSNRTVQILDSSDGTLLTSFQGSDTAMPGGSVAFLKWHPDGTQIASASYENIKIWDIENSTTVITLPQIDQSYPEAMDYSIDGKFAYIGRDGQINVISSFSDYAAQVGKYRFLTLSWNPAGTILAAGGSDIDGNGIWFYDVEGQLIDQIYVFGNVLSVSWSPDGSKIAARTPDVFNIWDVNTKTILSSFEDSFATDDYFVYWSPTGDRVATVGSTAVFVWDSTSGDIISTLIGSESHTDAVQSVAWNADGSKLWVASLDDVIRVWDITTASVLTTFSVSYSPSAMALSPDKTKIAVSIGNRMVEILDAETGILLSSFEGLDADDRYQYVAFLKWHPDGNQIASASFDNIKIWDIENSTTVAVFPQFDKTRPEAMDYSIDGKFAYIGSDGNVTIVDPSQVQPITNSQNAND